ncbi:MAG: restriction endonuclease subunit S [Proteobacteria bacterium]|nr:restriction endonuclease subunit S [Pseudomonadota bacterium]
MLNNVEWGEFKIGDLFKVDNWVYGKNKQYCSTSRHYKDNWVPVVSGITENNGVTYYTNDKLSDSEVYESELTISTRGEYSGTVFYQSGKFALANNVLVMEMPNLSKNQKQFVGGLINSLPYGGYSGYPRKDTLRNDIIKLPTKNGQIDFDFMERLISELEAERISELEAYLSVTGLRDYILTAKEQKLLNDFENEYFAEFNVIDEFHVKNSGNILSRDIVEDSGAAPYLCASAENNSVSSYISYNENYLDKGNCVFIGGKTFVVTYQEKDFYSNDSHNLILHIKDEEKRTRLNQLYLTTCINKSLKHKYSWGDSISNRKIQKDKISLPSQKNQPNYTNMETFISAIQKLVIKDLVLYIDRKIAAHKEVVGSL